MPTKLQTLVDVHLVARLHGASTSVPLGPKSSGPYAYAAIPVDPVLTKLATVQGGELLLTHADDVPSLAECLALAAGRLPQTEGWNLETKNAFGGIHHITPSGWVPGQGFSYAFQVKKNKSTLKRAMIVNGRAVTLDYLVVVQPHA